MWFRRKRPVSAPFDFSALPEPELASLEDMVSEGVMLTEFAGKMALKNHILVGALTGSEPYDPKHYVDAARAVLTDLIRISDASATLAVEERRAAADRGGASVHQHDYRAEDTENLRRREVVNAGVAERLSTMRDDDAYLAGFIERARNDAWSEIGSAITARLDRDWPSLDLDPDFADAEAPEEPGADFERTHRKRMRQLRRDLAALARERRHT
jgi:hypothetical protein